MKFYIKSHFIEFRNNSIKSKTFNSEFNELIASPKFL